MDKPIVYILDYSFNIETCSLRGCVLNHPTLGTGYIKSTKVVSVEATNGILVTENTRYKLVGASQRGLTRDEFMLKVAAVIFHKDLDKLIQADEQAAAK